MQHARLGAIVVLVGFLAACGDPADVARREPAPRRDPNQRYAVDATVLSNKEHGPELCTAVDLSLPPQCSGPAISGFDWAQVQGEESRIGVTWGDFHLVGTFDGTTFTLTEAPRPPERGAPPPPPDFNSPCPEPAGGWRAVDTAKASEANQIAALEHARTQPDHAGAWIDGTILNLAFTGELARHEQEARAAWGGPLCVSRQAHTLAELSEVQRRLTSEANANGVYVLGSSLPEIRNVVEAEVLIADEFAQRWVDDTFGKGLVVLTARFKSVAN